MSFTIVVYDVNIYIYIYIYLSAKESLVLYEMKPHKSLVDEEFSRFLDQRKQAKMQLLQDPNHSHVNNLNNVRREASRHFRGEK